MLSLTHLERSSNHKHKIDYDRNKCYLTYNFYLLFSSHSQFNKIDNEKDQYNI